MENKRIEYLDVAKGIGIILVVLAHAKSPLSNFIMMFHMPLFFLISGIFYKETYTDNFLQSIVKKIKRLYIPYITYQLIFLLLHNIFVKINIYDITEKYTYKDYISMFIKIITLQVREKIGGAMWFFVSLLEVSIIFMLYKFIIKKVFNRFNDFILGGIILLSFVIGYSTHMRFKLSTSLVALSFYYLGYLYKKYKNKINFSFTFTVISLLILYIISTFAKVEMSDNIYTNPIIFLLGALLGIYSCFYISLFISNMKLGKYLSLLGENTIPIICLHFLAFKAVTFIQICVYNKNIKLLSSFPILYSRKLWWVAYFIAGIFISLLIEKIYKKLYFYLKR